MGVEREAATSAGIAFTAIPTGKLRRYFSLQKVLFVLALAGTLVLIAVLLLGSRGRFQENLQRLTGLEYQGVIDTAKQNGYVTFGSFNNLAKVSPATSRRSCFRSGRGFCSARLGARTRHPIPAAC